LLSALEKRKHMLESMLNGPLSGAGYASLADSILEEDDDWEDWDAPEDTVLSFEEKRRKTNAELRKEILTLKHLIQLGRSVPADKKFQKLRESLLRLRKEGSPKFIIFTQFKTTMEYLAEALSDFKVVVFHGSLSLKEKEEAIEEFKTRAEVLISTEAGGEGRNLQFSNILINYDLPWSPLKIEQRIGRVHRFGQKKDVLIFNFSTRDTVAERVLEVLEQKIKLFEDSIGPSDALLGAIEDDGDFQKRVMEFVSGRASKKAFDDELESQIRISREGYGILNELVAPQRLDFNLHDYYDFTRASREIDNEAIEKLTLSYLRLYPDASYSLQKVKPVPGTASGDYMVRDLDAGGPARTATFKSSIALEDERVEFLAVGHPLVDRALMFFLASSKIHTVQSVSAAAAGMEAGTYCVFICRYAAGKGRAELMSCLLPASGGPPQIPQEILIPAGGEAADLRVWAGRKDGRQESPGAPSESLMNDVERARTVVEREALIRAEKTAEELRSQYDNEEYKIEVSYAKKIRGLEEKRDIQQLRCRTNKGQEHRALLAKIENQLLRAR
ncbi:MAG: DEAD/DEAH box helicase, partial [Spirochaetia bacterium]|nr:DEAD/DEAH box helicase [Spirochaetia bacterium]